MSRDSAWMDNPAVRKADLEQNAHRHTKVVPLRQPQRGRSDGYDAVGGLLMHLRALEIPEPSAELEFARGSLDRGWRFDLAWPESDTFGFPLAVEIDGEVHRTRQRFRADMVKFRVAQMLGWRVLHYRPEDVRKGIVIRDLLEIRESGLGSAVKAYGKETR